MERNRMEAFSDGVLAIVITIAVLNFELPAGTGIEDLLSLIPQILVYAMSFVYVGAYWNNHHHTLQTVATVNGRILWANLFFLFWISLLPFMTSWMSRHPRDWVPALAYGIVLVMTGLGYSLLQQTIIHNQDGCDALKRAVREDRWKGVLTGILYLAALILTPFAVHISQGIYAVLLLLWFVPDRRISRHLEKA